VSIKSKDEFIRKLKGEMDKEWFINEEMFLKFCESCIHHDECFEAHYRSDCSLSADSTQKLNKIIFPYIEELIKKSKFKPKG